MVVQLCQWSIKRKILNLQKYCNILIDISNQQDIYYLVNQYQHLINKQDLLVEYNTNVYFVVVQIKIKLLSERI